MAEGGIRNTATGDSVDVSCFYSHIHCRTKLDTFKLCYCPDLASACTICLIDWYV